MKPLSVILLIIGLSVSTLASQKTHDVGDILQCYVVEGRLVCETTRQPVDSNPKKKRPVFGRKREIITVPPESGDEMILAFEAWRRSPARVRQTLSGR